MDLVQVAVYFSRVEVLCIIVPSKEAASRGTTLREELKEKCEVEGMAGVIDRVFFKVVNDLPVDML